MRFSREVYRGNKMMSLVFSRKLALRFRDLKIQLLRFARGYYN